MEKMKLSEARTDLFMTQKELSEASGVKIVTISRCENGASIQLLTAKKLLKALNERGKLERLGHAIELGDLSWKVKGYNYWTKTFKAHDCEK